MKLRALLCAPFLSIIGFGAVLFLIECFKNYPEGTFIIVIALSLIGFMVGLDNGETND